ncbi:MAG TPA: serine protease [Turneriella sp.]|nr:serine protease [Turneriella sp.]
MKQEIINTIKNSTFKIGTDQGAGTCVCIEPGYFLTCAHVLDSQSWIELEDGVKILFQTLHKNKKYDFAKIKALARIENLAVINKQPNHKFSITEQLWVAGYPAEMDNLTFMPVTVSAITTINDIPAIRFYGAAIGGFSGAPVFTKTGALVAMVTNKASNFTSLFQGFISAQDTLNFYQPLLVEVVKNIKESSNLGFGYALPIHEIGKRAPTDFKIFSSQEKIKEK